jgi:hypothetical protein
MTTESFDVLDELRRLLAKGSVSAEAIGAILGISSEAAMAVAEARPGVGANGLSMSLSSLTDDQRARLSGLVVQLATVHDVEDDLRLRAILETLTMRFRLTPQNIALLTNMRVSDIEGVLHDPARISPERKYELAVRTSNLFLAIANATPRFT